MQDALEMCELRCYAEGYRAGIEAAAKACERLTDLPGFPADSYVNGCQTCIAHIRALLVEPGSDKP